MTLAGAPRGAPPGGFLSPGPASDLGIRAADRAASTAQSGRSAAALTSLRSLRKLGCFPGPGASRVRGYKPRPQAAAPLRLQDRLRRCPLDEQGYG
jgi:hypothetical protein